MWLLVLVGVVVAASACGSDDEGEVVPWATTGGTTGGDVAIALGGYAVMGGYPLGTGAYVVAPLTGGTTMGGGPGGGTGGMVGGGPANGGAAPSDGGMGQGGEPAGVCPSELPLGRTCADPGMDCSYPACCDSLGQVVVRCDDAGYWLVDESLTERCGVCPTEVPVAGTPCTPFDCATLEGVPPECSYPSDQCDESIVANCRRGSWWVQDACSSSG